MRAPIIAALLISATALAAKPAFARDYIKTASSGAMYPFANVAGETFARDTGMKAPAIEMTGTAKGFELFCEGTGDNTPDMHHAARKAKDSEIALCQKNGVTDIAEFPLGYNGVIIANKKGAPEFSLTKKQLFLALAKELPDANGKMAKNRYQTWKEVDETLPNLPIIMYGPGPDSGTYSAFIDLAMVKGCEKMAAFTQAFSDEKKRLRACRRIREDGKYIRADDNALVQKITADGRALALLGYNAYEQNNDKVQASKIEGIIPVLTAMEERYGISFRYYLYVKKQHIGMVPGIAEYVQKITSEDAISPQGYLAGKGLLPLSDMERKMTQGAADNLLKK